VQTLTVPGNPAPAGPLGIPGTWHSAFDDEFNGTSVGAAWQKGWLSNSEFTGPVNTLEDQGYDSANVTESGGSLHLAMRGGHGALVNTDGHLNFIYGAVEARIYLPGSGATVSNWPAFWLDGQTWPQDGENDIMEGLSGGTSCHFHSSSTDADGGCLNVGPGWHVFATDWEPGIVTWYYDGHKVGSLSSGTTGAPQYVIINNTSGATIGGPRDMSADMLVDYVRTWSH
jgi:beta-glucanase (GH16 family)